MSAFVKSEPEDHTNYVSGSATLDTQPKKYADTLEDKKIEAKDINGNSDPVIHEIPVFLAKSLAQKLYTIQFPVRPFTTPYDSSAVSSAKFKPHLGKLELEMSLRTDSNNFDKSKAEQLAVNVDGKSVKYLDFEEGGDNRKYPSGMMDKQIFTSSKSSSSSRYAIGLLTNNELHLTPLENVLTLRPSLDYLDNPEKTKQELKKEKHVESEEEEEGNEGSDAKQVTVRFAKTGTMSEKTKKAKEYESLQKKENDEQWINLNYNDIRSPAWMEESQMLFCRHLDADISSDECPRDLFLKFLK